MVSTNERWIRIFDINDISKHKNGFTIYKVVSMLYPESCPDAVTKVTVWKRFNDFKKLSRELKVLHRKLGLKNKYPVLPTKSLFKRVDDETICERKDGLLNFLEFIGNNQQLFTSNEFVKFLETSHTPADHLTSNINSIRAELNLPEDPEVCTSLSANSDDERTMSDADSITTISSLSPSVQTDGFSESVTSNQIIHPTLKKLNSVTSVTFQSSSKNLDTISITSMLDNITLLDGQIYPTPPLTPALENAGEYVQYIIDATVHVNLAIELENDKQYKEAFTAYKAAIDILLKYGRDDPNYDRKQMVRYKTEKYLIKAEKIYNMYLAPEIKNLQLVNENEIASPVEKPLFNLFKLKVVKIISSGMLVLNSELPQQLFYVKVIHKSMQFLNDNLILPENVPYMVKLQNHYNCENALFLVLEYCSGTKLTDYLKSYSPSDGAFSTFQEIQDLSDNESEVSFSDLVNDYSSNRSKTAPIKTSSEYDGTELDKEQLNSDDSYEKVEIDENLHIKNIMDEPLKKCVQEDLISKSQKLISSVDTTLNEQETKQKYTKQKVKEIDKLDKKEAEDTKLKQNQRKLSEMSSFEMEDFDNSLVLPEKTVVRWAAQLLLALEKLHVLGVVCRDLRTKNVLIDDKDNLVLTYMCNANDSCDLFVNGINHNLAPEIYGFQEITTAADWWSYGAILYELLVGVPLTDVHPKGTNSFTHLKIPKYVSHEGRSLLRQLLTYEPHDRLGSGINGTENIKSHPFFNSVCWDSLLSTFH